MQLVLATTVVEQFKGIPKDLVDMKYFWKPVLPVKLTMGKVFFVAGLLHDIGRLVMCLKVPDQHCFTLPKKRWYEILWFDHGGVGGALLRA